MRLLERFLIALDEGIWGAICRVGLGLAMPPVFGVLSGGQDSISGFLAFFLAVLIGLRVGPVVFRRALPFSAQAKDIWARRRALAKRYDSYQWQKLFWIGLGLLPYVVAAQGARPGELLVTALCLIGGGAGQLVWRKARADFGAPVRRNP
jgi:hypothetical protein